MTMIMYTRSAATVSWIDAATGLPEVDEVPPGHLVQRSFLTGRSGFRFVNLTEVWARYDDVRNSIVAHGFTPASGIYRSPSFGGIESEVFTPIRAFQVGREPITFIQVIGARTQSPERIGSILCGPLGHVAASAASAFPPIWSEVSIKIYNDGRTEASVLRHSLFPSMTFYTRPLHACQAPDERGPYICTPFAGNTCYNAVPNLARWRESGWGGVRGGTSGPTTGNPWNLSQPFDW